MQALEREDNIQVDLQRAMQRLQWILVSHALMQFLAKILNLLHSELSNYDSKIAVLRSMGKIRVIT